MAPDNDFESMNIFRATLLLMACLVATATAEQRPNFLFILVDDLGINDMSAEGSALKT